MKIFVGGVVGFLVVYILVALVFSLWPFSVVSGLATSVVNERSIISNYQWFYYQYNSIKAQAANYSSMPERSIERNGMRMVLNNSIAEYNSRSKQITRNLWKANDLPYQIEFESRTTALAVQGGNNE